MEKHYIVDGNAAKKIAEDLTAFLVAIGADEKTRLIGITQTEYAALRRGASLLLCVAVTDQPIVAGQELVAIVGWKPGDAPRMDTERVRLMVTGELFKTTAMMMTKGQIELMVGMSLDGFMAAANALVKHCEGIQADSGMVLPQEWLALPVEVIP